jgi:hypothetical protein
MATMRIFGVTAEKNQLLLLYVLKQLVTDSERKYYNCHCIYTEGI